MRSSRSPWASIALAVIASAGMTGVVVDEPPTPRKKGDPPDPGPMSFKPYRAPKKPDPERQAAAEAKRQRKAAKRLAAKEQSK